MPLESDRRSKRRIIVGADHTIQFIVKGHPFLNVRITNLSIDGCFATVHRGEVRLFTSGAILENLMFEHPDLPPGAITARVSYALGDQAHGEVMEFMGLGIQFIATPPETLALLQIWVDTH